MDTGDVGREATAGECPGRVGGSGSLLTRPSRGGLVGGVLAISVFGLVLGGLISEWRLRDGWQGGASGPAQKVRLATWLLRHGGSLVVRTRGRTERIEIWTEAQFRSFRLASSDWTVLEARFPGGPDGASGNEVCVRLAGLPSLRTVQLWSPDLDDIRPLRSLVGLRELDLATCAGLRDIRAVADLVQLRRLSLAGTAVEELAPLAACRQLEWLNLSRTSVTDPGPLAGLSRLQVLDLAETGVESLTPLGGMRELRVLNLWRTPVQDVTPLRALVQLRELELGQTRVTDLSPVSHLPYRQRLHPPRRWDGTAVVGEGGDVGPRG